MNRLPSRRPLRAAAVLVALLAFAGAGSSLAATFTITGVLKNDTGGAVAGADIAAIEYCTQSSVFLPSHTTLANGSFSLVLNEGVYDLHFTPPAGSTLAGAEVEDISLHANLNLGNLAMHAGIRVAGTVRNSGGTGLVGVDLDFVNTATGRKIFLPNDVTGTGGAWSVRVPSGTYDIEFRPLATTTLLTGERRSVVATADVTGLLDTLGTGVKMFGRVRDQRSTRIANADLDLYDTCSGRTIPTAHDNSDASGNFAVYVSAGTYTVTVHAPRCTSMGAIRLASQTVTADTDLGNNDLPDAVLFTGRVLDSAGHPVADADLRFFDSATGSRQGADHTHTDAAGNFSIDIPLGSYNVDIYPPSTANLLVGRFPVTIAGATPIGDLTLDPGIRLSGSLLGPGNSGVNNANINVVDSITRASVRLANDNTAVDGSYGVVVPPGTYDVQFIPPSCSPLAPGDRKSVPVVSATSVPAVRLVNGVHARGSVTDSLGAGVAAVDLDFFPAGTRSRVFTPGDNTSASGGYDVFIAPGLYDIDFIPPTGTAFRPAQRFGISLGSDVTLPTVVFTQGLAVTGLVTSSVTGLPVAEARLAFFQSTGGAAVFTAHDTTAADGSYSVIVDAGTYDIEYIPPSGSGLAPRWRRRVIIAANSAQPGTALLPLAMPGVSLFSPSSGTTRGGQTVTITGSGFQPDATVEFGGMPATTVTFVASTTLTAVTPAHPAGNVSQVVRNPGDQVGTAPGTYRYNEASPAVKLTVARSGGNILLTWPTTGQGSYTVLRSSSAGTWGGTTILGTTTALSYTNVGGAAGPGLVFYNVD